MVYPSEETRDSGFGEDGTALGSGSGKAGRKGGNAVTHKLKLMSHVPLKALKKSIKKASKALRKRDIQEDRDDVTETKEEQRLKEENLHKERLKKARRLSTKKIRASAFVKTNLVDEVEDLLALHDDEIQDDHEIEVAAMDEQDALARQRSAALVLAYSSRLEVLGRFMWSKRYFKLHSRFRTDIDTQKEVAEHMFMCYSKEDGTLQYGFDSARVTSLTLMGGPRPLVFVPHTETNGRVMLLSEALGKGIDAAVVELSTGETWDEEAKKFTFELTIAPNGSDSLHEQPLLLRSGKVHNFTNWIFYLRRAAGLWKLEPGTAMFHSK
jgi:hypothetical protein